MANLKEEQLSYKKDIEEIYRFLKEFTDFLPLPVININPVGFIFDANKSFEELTGFKKIEIIGTLGEKYFEEKDKFLKLQEMVLRGEIIKEEELTLLAKTKKIPVSLYFSPRKDSEGNIIGYFVGLYDMSGFKKLQEELEKKVKERTEALEKANEERTVALIRAKALAEDANRKSINLEEKTRELDEARIALMNLLEDTDEEKRRAEAERDRTQTIINNFTDGLLFFDQEKKLSLVNPQVEKFFKIKIQEIIGKSVEELAEIENLKPLINIIGKEIKQVFREELKITENFILEVSAIPVKEEIGTLVILHDISREKLVEKMKTEFVSVAAHQLRTPLSAIKWSISLLKEIVEEEEAKDLLNKLEVSTNRMISLIDDLLNVTRIEEGRYIYNPQLKDFIKIVENVVNPRIEIAQRKGVEIIFKKPKKTIPKVKVDEEKISLCVQNLVENAINYTDKGGVVVVGVSYIEDKKEVLCSVKDTGIGIPEDQKNRIFSKFFRAENAIRKETEGNGLGLFITKNIIEAHSGKIWFESEEGKGTTFYFTLPAEKTFEEFLKQF